MIGIRRPPWPRLAAARCPVEKSSAASDLPGGACAVHARSWPPHRVLICALGICMAGCAATPATPPGVFIKPQAGGWGLGAAIGWAVSPYPAPPRPGHCQLFGVGLCQCRQYQCGVGVPVFFDSSRLQAAVPTNAEPTGSHASWPSLFRTCSPSRLGAAWESQTATGRCTQFCISIPLT